ncbi:diacylglycerol kinase family protein [Streptomyces caniferus]|uniref:Diacylglycerol kinase family protein n=1 Tax=Streptomyces caniferus TaxID=285557 RepID=A0ABZ1VLN4_9ACTN|nr:diacylglycerol kinase family protein [Streptomyces caniferus]
MGTDATARGRRAQRRSALLAVAAAAAAALVLLVFAGLRSVLLLGVGAAGLAVTAAGAWWALTRRGLLRILAGTLAAAAPAAVLLLYVWAGLLWVVLVSLGLWGLAVSAGGAALSRDPRPERTPETPAAPPRRPFLIMNPRSGGGKVGTFRLKERAEELGAEVHLLDAAHHEDVVALARDAVGAGADLLGVAGGDGTQAMVAGVAAEHGIPFMVISAGTRNHFALDLGLDRDDPARCLDALTDGVELRVDLGFVGGRAFVNNASFGTYAAVVQSPAYRNDKVRTILEMLPDLLTHQRGPRLTVRAAGTAIDAPQAVLVSNNPYRMGDPAGLGRREDLDAGVLGVLGITVDNAAQAAGILRGRHGTGLTALTAGEVVVDADEPEIQAGVDGEALTLPTPVHCWIRPRALRVRVPRHRPGVPRAKPAMNWRRLRSLALTRERPAGDRRGA